MTPQIPSILLYATRCLVNQLLGGLQAHYAELTWKLGLAKFPTDATLLKRVQSGPVIADLWGRQTRPWKFTNHQRGQRTPICTFAAPPDEVMPAVMPVRENRVGGRWLPTL